MGRDDKRSYPLVRRILAERERSRELLDGVERERRAEARRRKAEVQPARVPSDRPRGAPRA